MTTSRVLAWLVGYHCLVSQFSRFLIGLLDYRVGTMAQVPKVHHLIRLSFNSCCQQIRESCDIQRINEWEEGRRREWDQHVTRMDAEKLVKISRDNVRVPVGRKSPRLPK